MQYRKGNISDLLDLKELGKSSYSEFSEVLTEENWKQMNSFLNDEKNLEELIVKSTVFVCCDQSKIVGMIYLMPRGNPTELFQEDWSYIRYLGVDSEYRGQGIGKELTDFCIKEARANGESFVALHTSEFMNAARNIYEKKGFEQNKEIQYLGKKYWIYLLNIS